ncbi:glycoside hydrolase family 3 N-terminal domain-containing protein [Agathobaculum butyriciproducens]|uniref:glycoside hydrolase family 3 N-terminal domain-containing protein n=1 Tax=Agathobaculum butyriciproducens TaxID=1628085 RepID=UPI0036D28B6A
MLILRPCATFRPTRAISFTARSFGMDAEQTGEYVRTVVTRMVSDKTGMVLKHFPGTAITRTRTPASPLTEQWTPSGDRISCRFRRASSGAQSVLVSHNVVNCMDADRPRHLPAEVHRIPRGTHGFDGVILTDDLIMDAIRDYTGGEARRCLPGYRRAMSILLTSSDFVTQYNAVLAAVQDGTIPESQIHASAVRVIDWKMQLGLISMTRKQQSPALSLDKTGTLPYNLKYKRRLCW